MSTLKSSLKAISRSLRTPLVLVPTLLLGLSSAASADSNCVCWNSSVYYCCEGNKAPELAEKSGSFSCSNGQQAKPQVKLGNCIQSKCICRKSGKYHCCDGPDAPMRDALEKWMCYEKDNVGGVPASKKDQLGTCTLYHEGN